jgi:hypothetical protein
MALITATAVNQVGTLVSLVAANTTDTITADDSTWLHVKNSSGGAITVSISDPGKTPVGNSPTVPAQSVAAGTERLFQLFARNNDPITNVTTITYSSVVSVTAGAFRG